MKKDGLIDLPRRGFIRLNERGRQVLKKNPKRIDVSFLEQFPEFVAFRALRGEESTAQGDVKMTPEEAMVEAYQRLRLSIRGVGRIDSRIVLIDGQTPAGLLVDYSVGVSSIRSYPPMKVDPDYFTED